MLAAGAARAGYAALRRRPPAGEAVWARTNHRGEPVTLLEGPAVAAAAAAAAALGPGIDARTRAALTVAAAGAAGFGGYDDLVGSGERRGFRGHLSALAEGEVTTGAVKLGGIGATGLAASTMLGGGPLDVAINAGLIAGGANLVNLFDLRPGRAIKVALAAGGLLAAGGALRRRRGCGMAATASPVAAAAALLPEDLAERAMLGDAGANALGAMLGVAAAASLPRSARLAALALVTGLTAASEVVSFTAVIERTPALRKLDMLGRRPPAVPPDDPAPDEGPAGQDGGQRGKSRSGEVSVSVTENGGARAGWQEDETPTGPLPAVTMADGKQAEPPPAGAARA
jgi:hypothetical protein